MVCHFYSVVATFSYIVYVSLQNTHSLARISPIGSTSRCIGTPKTNLHYDYYTQWMIKLKSFWQNDIQQLSSAAAHQHYCAVTQFSLLLLIVFFSSFFLNLFEPESENNLMFLNNNNTNDIKLLWKPVKISFTLDVICKVLIWKIFQNKIELNHNFTKFSSTNN